MKKSFTLIELLIAMTFFSVLILGTTAFYLASSRFTSSSQRRAQVLNEASTVLEHITKNALSGIGSLAIPAFSSTAFTSYGESLFSITQDSDGNPDNNGGDITVGYAQATAAGCPNRIFFCSDTNVNHRAFACDQPAGHETLTNRAISFTINSITGNTATVTVTLRFDPTTPFDPNHPYVNPQVSLTTTISAPAQSAN